ncbi:30S ribosome-binding factor RbfA [Permianibacter sp. IMCC34836]|uniref:30S ribosome-binding factor RbfA n=1 Tax=Permianibacter fluminis TaxID=2738515 RepID=UPI001555B452|nr:30S ribosome-binding factor RbfA [Permianibacter fluminis]NQD36528.1 30S ribosome-binding factor RbfA [Permianibacter fluminis]
MAREFKRTDRVGDEIQRELALLLQREVKDPRVPMTTVSAVKVSRDLLNANVYVTFLGRDKLQDITEAVKVLNNMSGFLRSALAQRIRMRQLPRLMFHYDDSLARGRHLSSLIDSAIASDQARAHHDDVSRGADEEE